MKYNTVRDIREEFVCLHRNGRFIEDKSGVKLLEIVNASFIADEDFIFGDPNPDYIRRELEWYKSQSLYIGDIPGRVPKIWQMVASKDGKINSNYGYLIWSKENYSQYEHCLRTLIDHPQSRRAVMIYTRPSIQIEYNKDGMSDFICTDAVQYFIRDGKLDVVVYMRSNDAWAGYRNDVAFQRYVHSMILNDYNVQTVSKVSLGRIYWNAASLHVYESQFKLIEDYIYGQNKISERLNESVL